MACTILSPSPFSFVCPPCPCGLKLFPTFVSLFQGFPRKRLRNNGELRKKNYVSDKDTLCRYLIRFKKDCLRFETVTYMQNEMSDIWNIFTTPNYQLDNNEIERVNHCISLMRHNSLFFGSHAETNRAAIYYSLVCSCHQRGVFFSSISLISGIIRQRYHPLRLLKHIRNFCQTSSINYNYTF